MLVDSPFIDIRARALGILIEANELAIFGEALNIIPKSVLARIAQFNWESFNTKMERPSRINLKDVILLSALMDCDPGSLTNLLINGSRSHFEEILKERFEDGIIDYLLKNNKRWPIKGGG